MSSKTVVLIAVLILVLPGAAQTVDGTPEAAAEGHNEGTEADSTPPAESSDALPLFNLYLPEGEFDIRVSKLVRNVLFEGQVNYNFVDGDVSTFLRYKYYARNFTYRIGVFDSLEFESIDAGSDDFDRTRGALVLFEYPVSYNRRYLGLVEVDALNFGDVTNVDNDKDNVYLKLGFQLGTPFDERLNSIVGEARGRVTPVLTAYREIGPWDVGAVIAVTQGLSSVGDYEYTKFQTEALKRFRVGGRRFVITRLHAGSVVVKKEVRDGAPPIERYSTPRYEYFRIGGRDALKGLDDSVRGSDEIHVSNEFFFPIFIGREYDTWRLRWKDMYGIVYAGAGNIGFESSIITEISDWVADAGIGVEALLRYRDHNIYMTAIYAQTIVDREGLDNAELRFNIRTSR